MKLKLNLVLGSTQFTSQRKTYVKTEDKTTALKSSISDMKRELFETSDYCARD